MSVISYDAIPYEGTAVEASHPRRLAALGRLFGIETPPPSTARILEIGSAVGENLNAIAASLPRATCLGIDNAPRQVQFARAVAARLGLANVRFEVLDIMDAGPDLGTFDYVIAHGVYSWVEEPVRDRLLRLCRELLAPNGIAFVSYNCYPGWYLRQPLRELMVFSTRQLQAQPGQLVAHARAMAEIVVRTALDLEARLPGGPLYAQVLARELAFITERPDDYLAHEHLEPTNAPVYLADFVRHAGTHGLQYLGDAWPLRMALPDLARNVAAEFQALAPGPVEREQLLDFVHGRTFRESLLCHIDRDLGRPPSPRRLHGLALRLLGDFIGPGEDRYDPVLPKLLHPGGLLAIRHRDLLTALHRLAERRPAAVPVDELAELVGPDQFWADTAPRLLRLFLQGGLQLEAEPVPIPSTPGPRPRAFAMARDQALRDDTMPVALTHAVHDVPPLPLALLPYLDGSRTLDDLAELVVNVLAPSNQDDAIRAAGVSFATARVAVAGALAWLARRGFLEH
ncbi:class I SAM-dependent methyltransferase [Tepidiforma sp.]|uniref:class I SAM-dependent methyltransferase n=1 Tax=Tepidiforma sp. TaxID=2682230 RepID=UPI002ADD5728|nr:class I SAM-dependent methyltransferase [Tepidiforma sp.]